MQVRLTNFTHHWSPNCFGRIVLHGEMGTVRGEALADAPVPSFGPLICGIHERMRQSLLSFSPCPSVSTT